MVKRKPIHVYFEIPEKYVNDALKSRAMREKDPDRAPTVVQVAFVTPNTEYVVEAAFNHIAALPAFVDELLVDPPLVDDDVHQSVHQGSVGPRSAPASERRAARTRVSRPGGAGTV